jgi:ectoine hydroxylase-related dioxygenase (phytanoyl-CoA dioxygenase family)
VALSDYTEEMGATRIVPGSHKAGKDAKFEQSDTVAAEMARGPVMVYSGKLYHGSGHNRSDRVRRALDLGYSVAWVRQEENQYLACPPEIARTLPDELLRLMGYETVRGYGHIGRDRNGGDPLTVLQR